MPRRPAPLPALIAIVVAIVVALAAPLAVTAADDTSLSDAQRDTLLRYADDTWAGFVAMTDPDTGLPADSLAADGTPSVQTSTTNIGAYMWSTVVAEALGIIEHDEAVERLTATISSLETMERHEPSGQYYNWYDHTTGKKLTVWPPTGEPTGSRTDPLVGRQRLAGCRRCRSCRTPSRRSRIGRQRSTTAWTSASTTGPNVNRIAFHLRAGVPAIRRAATTRSSARAGSPATSGSPRASCRGRSISARGGRSPTTCDWNWHETKPVGFNATYLGVNVFEGAYPYEDFRVVPGWGGSMFEALMPALFVPEEEWAPRSWAVNHPLTITAQIHHGLVDAGYGYWGFSPANIPEGGYSVYGVDAIGMDPGGYPSNEDKTLVDRGFEGCPGREPQPDPPPSRTPTAWSPRTRRSSRCAGRPTRSWRIWPIWRQISTSTTSGGSATASTSTPGRCPARTCRSTRGSSWPRSGTRSPMTSCVTPSRPRRSGMSSQPVIGMERFNAGPASAVDYDPAP